MNLDELKNLAATAETPETLGGTPMEVLLVAHALAEVAAQDAYREAYLQYIVSWNAAEGNHERK